MTTKPSSSSSMTMHDHASKRAKHSHFSDGKVHLNEDEGKVLALMKEVVKRFQLKTTVRVAGGWVRDKLLGRDSHDIDIALDDMSGMAFAEKVNTYLKEVGAKTRSIGLIQVNPDQSKHLETATAMVLDMNIDFVNLRAEEYHETSRIPQSVKFGTPKEDAERRDFTINALFYNVIEDKVEDFTARGLEDLANGIIRTPLDAMQTFHDDPLRMMRAIRFASRFKFELHPDIQNALRHPTNRRALNTKISRERIGIEFANMMNNNNACVALDLLVKYDLVRSVIRPFDYIAPANVKENEIEDLRLITKACNIELDKIDWKNSVTTAENLFQLVFSDRKFDIGHHKDFSNELVILTGLLTKATSVTAISSKCKEEPFVGVVIRDNLKYKSALAAEVQKILDSMPKLEKVTARIEQDEATAKIDEELVLQVGKLLHELKVHFELLLCLASICHPSSSKTYETLHEWVHGVWNLTDIYNEKPIMDGKTLMKELGFKKGGPFMRFLMEQQERWQILNRMKKEPADQQKVLAFVASFKEQAMAESERLLQERLEEQERQKRLRKERRAKEVQERLKREQAESEAMSLEDKNVLV